MMIEPVFWNPLPAAAAWLTHRTGRTFNALNLADCVASMGKQGDAAPTIIKATLPRELTYAVISARALNHAPVQQNPAMNAKYNLPVGFDYVKTVWPTTVPLAVNHLLEMLVFGHLDLSVLSGAVTTNRHEDVWVMPWGAAHRATIETCGINKADLLVLGEALATDKQPQAVPVEAVPVESDSTTPSPESVVQVPTSKQAKRPTLWGVVTPYIVETMRAGQYASAKQLFNALEAKAGADSPFDKGTGNNRGSLFAREILQPMAMKTLQTRWPTLKVAAKK